jgi:D-alanyl-lipoteichoic acid acyltransferase DltB (MBOAT superfamily)
MDWENLSVGLTIFTLGLFKKVVLADGVAPFAAPVFAAAAAGETLSFFPAWCGALAFTFQLYFDFSGYSDMAIGVSRLFGVRLPLNFNSPYKAVSIVDFWRRWHMTLSRFLRDYLYFALGGNRKGPARRYLNLFTTMLLGGLWHGAGWTYIFWGALHGIYLGINHAWRSLCEALGYSLQRSTVSARNLGRLLTFLAVVVSWVFFRADSLDSALGMLRGMAGLNGISLPGELFAQLPWQITQWLDYLGIDFETTAVSNRDHAPQDMAPAWIASLWALVWFAPNTQEIMIAAKPALNEIDPVKAPRWQPSFIWLSTSAVGLFFALSEIGKDSEFLYFQF